jgi:predicted kinase
VVVTHGVTGSSKTPAPGDRRVAGAIRIRSDVERKRLMGLDAGARTGSAGGRGVRASEPSTYQRLAPWRRDRAAGYPVVVDAAFLERWQRDLLRGTAAGLHVPFAILDCPAPSPCCGPRQAAARRRHDASEATIDVLEHQLATAEPLAADEL